MITPLVLLITAMASAQTADKGYVVRVDSDTVWLDLTAADGAAVGRAFEVYTEGAELKHPVTGAVLGRVQDEVARGVVKDLDEKFSTGAITARKGDLKAGQRARFSAAAPAPAVKSAPLAAGQTEGRAPKTQGATLPFSVSAMAVGDFDGGGKPQVVLASENAVMLYAYPVTDSKPLAEAVIPGTGLRILGLEATTLDGGPRATLLVSVYDDTFKRFETRAYRIEAGKWLKVGEYPFLTRGYQDPKGERRIATQQVLDDKTFPFGAIYPLAYQDGKFVQGKPKLGYRRVDWLFGFTTAQLGAIEASLYYTPVHALRVQLGKEYWRTPDDDYGQTPLRIRWQEKLLEFHPPMATLYGPKGFEALVAVRNMAALGGLASPFGLFNKAELVRKRWNGLAFENDWAAPLPGAAQGLAVVETPAGRELAVAVRGSAGQSSVWTFDP